ncbi:MAG: hypothetical protein HQ500_10900 [Flavobacteriales bacterium]|nr:hypothetical protein [Flavobacteriales bacterium]
MNWEKQGHIFAPKGQFDWMNSHAANPFGWRIDDGIYRVYFSSRDSQNRSHVSSCVVDFNDGAKVIDIESSPVLAPGDLGLFDDSGVMMGFMLQVNDRILLFYLGWNLKVTVPWLNTIGLAESTDGGVTFRKLGKAPLLDRSEIDPFSISYPSVLPFNDGYKMWYGSNLSWGNDQSQMNHVIKSALSSDCTSWERTGQIEIDIVPPHEYALSKPFAIEKDGKFYMWYSYRAGQSASTYRIGWAHSDDGVNWLRNDDSVGIKVSKSGWDSEMIEYPWVGKMGENYLMLYNGNGYGQTGFGYALSNSLL